MTTRDGMTKKTADLVDNINPEVWRDRLLPMLRRPAGTTIDSIQIARVYPSRLDGFGVQAEVTIIDQKRQRITGFVYLTSGMKARGAVSRHLRIRPSSPFKLHGVWCPLDQSPLVLHTADRDDALPCLPLATAKSDYSLRLRSIAGAPFFEDVKRWHCELGNYRPRRRCTLLYRGEQPRGSAFLVGKMFRKGQAAKHGATARRLSTALRRVANDLVVAPRVRAVWPDWNMVVFQGLGDGTVHDRQSPFELSRPAADVLARLHLVSIEGLSAFGPTDELNATRRWIELADRLGRLRPLGRRIWSTLSESAPGSIGARGCVIHRDFYASQLLPLGEQWGLVDFDTAAIGDPEQDIANYLGHMIWDCVMAGQRTHDWLDAGLGFLSQYSTASAVVGGALRLRPIRINAQRLRFYLTSSLLRVGIIHSLRTGHERRALQLHRVASGNIFELLEIGQIDRCMRAAV